MTSAETPKGFGLTIDFGGAAPAAEPAVATKAASAAPTETRLLILGSGPAGLTAAIYAARAALEAALRADMGDSWTDRAMSFFRTQTGARSLTPREGSDPDAILSRAEAALAKGDLVTTLAELDSLPEVARAAMADWRSTADQRLSAITALRELADTIGG